MAFRGINLEPMHRHIQLYLQQLSYVLSNNRGNYDGYFGGKESSMYHKAERVKFANGRIPWVNLRSNAVINAIEYEDWQNSVGDWTERISSDSTDHQLPYSTMGWMAENAQAEWHTRSARQLQGKGRRNTPPPGITNISIDTKGNLGSVKTAKIQMIAHSVVDLEILEANYMTPGITCFLEWGWGKSRPLSIEEYGKCNNNPSALDALIIAKQLGLEMTENGVLDESSILENNQYNYDAIGAGVGQYDAMLGVITKFNWSLNKDMSFNISIDLLSPNSLMMNASMTTNILNASKVTFVKEKVDGALTDKTSMTDASAIFEYFKNCMQPNSSAIDNQNLPKDMADFNNANTERRVNYTFSTKTEHQDKIGKLSKFEILNIEDFNKWFPVKGPEAIAFCQASEAMPYGDRKRNYDVFYMYTENAIMQRGGMKCNKAPESMRSPQKWNEEKGKEQAQYLDAGDNRRDLLGLMAYPSGKSTETELYVTWGFVEDYIINKIMVPKDKDGNPIFTFSSTHTLSPDEFLEVAGGPMTPENKATYLEAMPNADTNLDIARSNLLVNSPYIVSFDPGICWIPEKVDHPATLAHWLPGDHKDGGETLAGKYYEAMGGEDSMSNTVFYPLADFGPNQFGYPNRSAGALSGQIRGILLNANWLEGKINSARSIEAFVNSVFAGINDACGMPWDFTIKSSPSDTAILQVVDNNWVQARGRENVLTRCKSVEELQEWAEEQSGKMDENLATQNRIDEWTVDNFGESRFAPHSNFLRGHNIATNLPSINVTPFSDTKGHLEIIGVGDGNVVRNIQLNSKLPKGMQAMAYMANASKASSQGVNTKEEQSFRLYDHQMRDGFYSPGISLKQVEAADRLKEEKDYQKIETWINNIVSLLNTEVDAKNASGVAKQMVASHVYRKADFNTDSLPRLMPIEITLDLDGISGIHQGNAVKLATTKWGGVLPARFQNRVIFQVTKVRHTITNNDWKTKISCMMRMYSTTSDTWSKGLLDMYTGIWKKIATIKVGPVMAHPTRFSPQFDKDSGTFNKVDIERLESEGRYGGEWYDSSGNFLWTWEGGTMEGGGMAGGYGYNPYDSQQITFADGREPITPKAGAMYDKDFNIIGENAGI